MSDNRPTLRYRGRVAAEQLGQIMGPTPFGELLVIDEITFDPDYVRVPFAPRGRSTVRLRNATQPEVEQWRAIVASGLMARVNA